MPELRRDYLTNELVSIAKDRAKRPIMLDNFGKCPFCPENRHMLPGIIYDDGYVMAVPNLYPILSVEAEAGYGLHEVIIDTPRHKERLFDIEAERIVKIFLCFKERMLYHRRNEKIKYVQIFKNSGSEAGASISHSHWQLLAMPFIPPRIETILHNAMEYKLTNNECYFCNLIKNLGKHIIFENPSFVAYTPYASKFNYEVCIIAKEQKDFTVFSYEEMFILADILKKTLHALKQVLDPFNYNILFYTGDCIHFNMQIIPRIGKVAGCELSSGVYTNPVYPEEAAQILKSLSNHSQDSQKF